MGRQNSDAVYYTSVATLTPACRPTDSRDPHLVLGYHQSPPNTRPGALVHNTLWVEHQLFTCTSLPSNSDSIYDIYMDNVGPLVVVIAGSVSDTDFVKTINGKLENQNIIYHNYFHSAHKETLKVMSIIDKYDNRKGKTVIKKD